MQPNTFEFSQPLAKAFCQIDQLGIRDSVRWISCVNEDVAVVAIATPGKEPAQIVDIRTIEFGTRVNHQEDTRLMALRPYLYDSALRL
jgi:hypothetical protein